MKSDLRLLQEIRRLREQFREIEIDLVHEVPDKPVTQDQITYMIETWPEVFGKGGTQRTWLERFCAENGTNDSDYDPMDHGMGGDDGKFNK